MSSEIARIGILTVSDRASRGEYEDRGGPAIAAWLTEVLCSDWKACPRMVSDDLDAIMGELVALCSDCSLVITTGGDRAGTARCDSGSDRGDLPVHASRVR